MARKNGELNAKQARFAAEYLIDGNATQAAIRAGYSEKTAYSIGQRLLKHVEVAKAVASGQRAATERAAEIAGLSRARVLTEVEMLAHSRIDNYVIDAAGNVSVRDGVPESAMGAISSIKRKEWSDGEGGHTVDVELRFWDKPGMVRLAGKHLDIEGFSDRVEHTGRDGAPIAVRTEQTTEEMRRELAGLLGREPIDDKPAGHRRADDDDA